MKTKKLFYLAAVFASLAGSANAALVMTDLGDRGDGYNVIRFSYSNSGDNTGTWTVPPGVTSVQVLVVGGGGSGSAGINYKWGGGGGGVIDLNSYAVTSGASLTVTVGIGGASANGNNPGRVGNAGGQSQFGTLIAYGGTGGGISTGGTSGSNNYNGAGGLSSSTRGGSGVGQAATDPYGTGGNGLTSTIISSTFASAKGLPYDQGYYGGGGAGYPPTQGGATVFGGLGGGGDITDTSGDSTGGPGLDGLGGGGAGSSGARASGAGGDGVIYVAYTTIPEPGTSALLAGGAIFSLLCRSRRAKKQQLITQSWNKSP